MPRSIIKNTTLFLTILVEARVKNQSQSGSLNANKNRPLQSLSDPDTGALPNVSPQSQRVFPPVFYSLIYHQASAFTVNEKRALSSIKKLQSIDQLI